VRKASISSTSVKVIWKQPSARGAGRQRQSRRESVISMRRDWLTADCHCTRIGLW
jgi:hypothetical protein